MKVCWPLGAQATGQVSGLFLPPQATSLSGCRGTKLAQIDDRTNQVSSGGTVCKHGSGGWGNHRIHFRDLAVILWLPL